MTTAPATASAATPGSRGVDWSFLGDETFWLTIATVIAAVLSSIGLGHLATSVRAAIDAAAGSIALVYVGGKAHQRGQVITAAASAVDAGVAAVAPPNVAELVDQLTGPVTQNLVEHFSKALAGATTPAPAAASSTGAPAAG